MDRKRFGADIAVGDDVDVFRLPDLRDDGIDVGIHQMDADGILERLLHGRGCGLQRGTVADDVLLLTVTFG